MNCDAMADESREADRLMADKSKYDKDADRVDFMIDMVIGSIAKEVLAERTPYFHGVKRNDILDVYLDMFQKLQRASTHFMKNSDSDVHEHITRKHVRDIVAAYGPHLKDPPNFTFTHTYGNEFYFILKKVDVTMKLWN